MRYLYKAAFDTSSPRAWIYSDDTRELKELHFGGRPAASLARFESPADFAPLSPDALLIAQATGLSVLSTRDGTLDAIPNSPGGELLNATPRSRLFLLQQRALQPPRGRVSLFWVTPEASIVEAGVIRCLERPDGGALSPSGELIALYLVPSQQLLVIDLKTRTHLYTIPPPGSGPSISFSPNGRYLATGGSSLKLYETSTGRLLASETDTGSSLGDVVFTPQGDFVLTTSLDGSIKSYRVPREETDWPKNLTAEQVLNYRQQPNAYELGVSPDGHQLLTVSSNRTLRLWKR